MQIKGIAAAITAAASVVVADATGAHLGVMAVEKVTKTSSINTWFVLFYSPFEVGHKGVHATKRLLKRKKGG